MGGGRYGKVCAVFCFDYVGTCFGAACLSTVYKEMMGKEESSVAWDSGRCSIATTFPSVF